MTVKFNHEIGKVEVEVDGKHVALFWVTMHKNVFHVYIRVKNDAREWHTADLMTTAREKKNFVLHELSWANQILGDTFTWDDKLTEKVIRALLIQVTAMRIHPRMKFHSELGKVEAITNIGGGPIVSLLWYTHGGQFNVQIKVSEHKQIWKREEWVSGEKERFKYLLSLLKNPDLHGAGDLMDTLQWTLIVRNKVLGVLAEKVLALELPEV